jgi:hypothetical protein
MRSTAAMLLTVVASLPANAADRTCAVRLEDEPSLHAAWRVVPGRAEAECRSCDLYIRIDASGRPDASPRPSTDHAAESKAFLDQMLAGPNQPQATIDFFRNGFKSQSRDCDITVAVDRVQMHGLHFLAVRNTHYCPKEEVQHFGATEYRAVDNGCSYLVTVSWRRYRGQRGEPLAAGTLDKIQNFLDRLHWLD